MFSIQEKAKLYCNYCASICEAMHGNSICPSVSLSVHVKQFSVEWKQPAYRQNFWQPVSPVINIEAMRVMLWSVDPHYQEEYTDGTGAVVAWPSSKYTRRSVEIVSGKWIEYNFRWQCYSAYCSQWPKLNILHYILYLVFGCNNVHLFRIISDVLHCLLPNYSYWLILLVSHSSSCLAG